MINAWKRDPSTRVRFARRFRDKLQLQCIQLVLKFDGTLSTHRTTCYCDEEGLHIGTVLTGLSAFWGLSIEGSRVE